MTTGLIPTSAPAPARVLFIDDDLGQRNEALEVFRDLGLSVDVFANCEKALEAADNRFKEGNPYKAVLTDYNIESTDDNPKPISGVRFIAELHKRKNVQEEYIGDIIAVSSSSPFSLIRKGAK